MGTKMGISSLVPPMLKCMKRNETQCKAVKRKELEMRELKRISDGTSNATLGYIVSQYSMSHNFCFTLLDDGNVEMTTEQFVNALTLILSDDFDELLELINNREKAHSDMNKYYSIVSLGVEDGNSCTSDLVYELVHAGKRYGRFNNMVREMKDDIINAHSWGTWCDACRLYEGIYRVPREWIS